MNEQILKGLLISDFTSDVLKAFLTNLSEAPSCHINLGPFGNTIPVLQDPQNAVWKTSYDFTVVWTQITAVIPSFKNILEFQEIPDEELINQCDLFISALKIAATHCPYLFLINWQIPEYYRGLGTIDLKPKGIRYRLDTLNRYLGAEISKTPNIYLFSVDKWLKTIGERATDPRLWYMSKIPFDPSVFKLAALDIKAALRSLQGQARKLIILDLDNTLWGGIVGDDGWQHLRLGGHDPQGEAFADFQRVLKSYLNRGIILALASKNQEKTVWEAFEKHPEMVLKRSDFSAYRINWQDKVENIIELLKELNLTQEAAVFIDDNPAERDRVQKALPGILVPAWPENSLLYTKALFSLSCFDTANLTDDDRKRVQMYAQEKERHQQRQSVQDPMEWLASLQTTVTVSDLTAADLPRATQLLNKTNQMNLTTRRLSEGDFLNWANQSNHRVWVFRVQDKLGDSGLTGIVSFEYTDTLATIVDFVLSCRVFGRFIENVMVNTMIDECKHLGVHELKAVYLKTDKNQPCLEFLTDRSHFTALDGKTFIWNFKSNYPATETITIKHLEALKP